MSSKTALEKNMNSMWGGRFKTGPAELMEAINASISFDKVLYKQDIRASQVHARMLGKQGIISDIDAQKICAGLDQIRTEIDDGEFEFKTSLEDIHMNIEARLSDLIGDAAGRLHTARSRNDQVITDVKLWVLDTITVIEAELKMLIASLINKARENNHTAMPGFTHLQVAQPVSFGHHLLAYVEMLGRDLSRLQDCRERMNECPLGCAALAGTTYPIDRHWVAKELGFKAPTENSMDSVSSRDFIAEFIFFASMCSVNLSRLGEELVNWNSQGFKFVELTDAFTSGSSIMPQKKNPDAAELLRGKPARIIGSLNSLLVLIKGLPLSFMKDMQEDKEPLFDAAASIELCIKVAAGLINDLEPNKKNMNAFLDRGFATATDLADWLVVTLDIPFRNAHHITARIVGLAAETDSTLASLSLEQMQAIEPRITNDVFDAISNKTSLENRNSYGGTAPANVLEACDRAEQKYMA